MDDPGAVVECVHVEKPRCTLRAPFRLQGHRIIIVEAHSVLMSAWFRSKRVCVRDNRSIIEPVLVRMCTARGRHVVMQQCHGL